MRMKQVAISLSLATMLVSGPTVADTAGSTGMINYRWMNQIVNKTPVAPSACPEINTDIYGAGYSVTLKRSFYGNVAAIGSTYFPNSGAWASVGVGPIKNDFSFITSNISNISELEFEKKKSLPLSADEVSRWKVTDSAYWETNGGVSLYVGTGIMPIDLGVFVVATGGWANYFQKTGPNRVYVERSKKTIRSVNVGVGVGRPNASIDRNFENMKGFAYEFTLDNPSAIEAFERFMAGDQTKAQELESLERSGVKKISSLQESYSSWARAFGLTTPFIPVLAFKTTTTSSYDVLEENSVWDEQVIKDTGAYVKQRSVFIGGTQINESRSFMGGKVFKDFPGLDGRAKTESSFGNFKFAYQSNWGQEKRLRRYINKVKALTGLVDETCATVPAFDDTLGFNQVVLEMNWSDEYVQELAGTRSASANPNANINLLKKIKAAALNFEGEKKLSSICAPSEGGDINSDSCGPQGASVESIFANLETYSNNMKKFKADRKEFAKNLTNFGQEVWKSPAVFKAFYERGKLCGQEFRYEVSGQRLTRHAVVRKFNFTEACNN